MSKLRCTLLIAVLAIMSTPAWAQEDGAEEATSDDSKMETVLRKFEPYGRFLAHLAMFDDEAEIQDNASWLGLKFRTGDEYLAFFAHAEFGVNLIGQTSSFKAGVTTENGFLTLENLEEPDVFGSRYGYLGVDFGDLGKITLGKQNGVHYNIASYTTDQYTAFGGQGSLAYPSGGDGGVSGTGRADSALNYTVPIMDVVEIGLQTVFSNSGNEEVLDGFGASIQVHILDGLTIGGAFTQTEIADVNEDLIRGVDGDSEYGIFGVKYTSDIIDVGAVYSTQKNGDLVQVPDMELEDPILIPIVFDGDGIEIYVRGKIGDFTVVGGYIHYSPDVVDALIHPDFETNYFVLGGDWRFAEGAWVYTEFKIDNSSGFDGVEGSSVGTLGFKYQFSWNTTHNP